METGIVNLRGKEYRTVALRLSLFRHEHPDFTISTSIHHADAQTVIVRAEIIDPEGRLIASAFAEENRRAGPINATSALENCETSAVGRALAFFGLAGSEIASAEEVSGAIQQQEHGAASVAERAKAALLTGDWAELCKLDRSDPFWAPAWSLLSSKDRSAIKGLMNKRSEYRDQITMAARENAADEVAQLTDELTQTEKIEVWKAFPGDVQEFLKQMEKEISAHVRSRAEAIPEGEA